MHSPGKVFAVLSVTLDMGRSDRRSWRWPSSRSASSMTPSSTSTPISPRATTPTSSSPARSTIRQWLGTFAFDLQPLPKYFIGAGLRAAHMRQAGLERRGQVVRGCAHPLRSSGDADDRPRPVHRGGGDGLSGPLRAGHRDRRPTRRGDCRPSLDRSIRCSAFTLIERCPRRPAKPSSSPPSARDSSPGDTPGRGGIRG